MRQKPMQKFLSLLEAHYKYILAAILIVIPLYPKFPFLRVPGTYVSIRIEDFFLAMALLLMLPYLFINLKKISRREIEKSMFLYLLAGAISLLSAVFITETVQIHIGFLHLARRVEYLTPFFLGVYAFRKKDPRLLEFLLKTLMLTVIILTVYGIGQRYFSWPVIITQNVEYAKGIALRWTPGSHINSTFAGHYDLASFLVLTLPVFIALLFELKGRKTRLILLSIILGGIWLLVVSVSRISIVSYIISVSLAFLILGKPKELLAVLLASAILFGFSGDLRARYLMIFNVVRQRVDKMIVVPGTVYAQNGEVEEATLPPTVVEDRSTSIRFNVEWPRAVRAFTKNPLLGTGYSSITLATDNDYLRALGETGILGFSAFILIFFRIGMLFKRGISVIEKSSPIERAFLAGVIGAFPGILLNAVFIDIFEASKFAITYWLFVGIAVGLLRIKKNEQNL